jgi:alcohol dehydrogenase class IV
MKNNTNFEFAGPGRILFGRGRIAEIGRVAGEFGKRALVVTNADRSGKQGLIERLKRLLAEAGISAEIFRIEREPIAEDVDRAAEAARRAELVIGLGGGSAIDAAKAAAAVAAGGGACMDYMEVVGGGKAITKRPMPFIAVATTGGTGAEATKNAVIGCPEKRYKASLRSPLMLARVAIVDPELHVHVRPEVTARCGMDALTQLIESYTSKGANALTDGLAMEGLRRAARSLRRAVEDGTDLDAREDMALAALISGMTLANAGLGAAHGIAAPVCAMVDAPHGAVCAALVAHVMRANIAGLRAAGNPALGRYAEIGRILTGNHSLSDDEAADAGAEAAGALARDLKIPGLGEWGLTEGMLGEAAGKARKASSMRWNPIEIGEKDLAELIRKAL